MAKLTEEYKRRARREATKTCPLCTRKLEDDENKRGVVEFLDGWFFICGRCKAKVGKTFDLTENDDYGQGEAIRYFKRSRKHILKWLLEEYQINIGE